MAEEPQTNPEITDEDSQKTPLLLDRRFVLGLWVGSTVACLSIGITTAVMLSMRKGVVFGDDIEEMCELIAAQRRAESRCLAPAKPVFEEPTSPDQINSGTTLVLFAAHYCPACRPAGVFLEGKTDFFKKKGIKPFEFFDAEEEDWPPLAEGFLADHELRLPSVLVFSDGQLVGKFTGFTSSGPRPDTDISELPAWISTHPELLK